MSHSSLNLRRVVIHGTTKLHPKLLAHHGRSVLIDRAQVLDQLFAIVRSRDIQAGRLHNEREGFLHGGEERRLLETRGH